MVDFAFLRTFFDFIRSMIGLKQGCPLLPNFFGDYIDELEVYPREYTHVNEACL